jgi:hypothetical protein
MIEELPYREVNTEGMPYTTVEAGNDWVLTITRLLGMTEVITGDANGGPNTDPIYVKGHPPEAEIVEWWLNVGQNTSWCIQDSEGNIVPLWKFRWYLRWARIKHLIGL